MPNFVPLRNYLFFCLDQLIEEYHLCPPFLDVGCGTGDLSKYVALKRKWYGKAIDFSDVAINRAKQNLASLGQIKVEKKPLFEENASFETIFLVDVLEHVENDNTVLKKLSSLLGPNGYILMSVPSNPREWRWDDDFYGHFRRYTVEEIRNKLINAGLVPVLFWDFTYPFFWIMRRIYTALKPSPRDAYRDKETRTKESSTVNAWDGFVITPLLTNRFADRFFWNFVYRIQFPVSKTK